MIYLNFLASQSYCKYDSWFTRILKYPLSNQAIMYVSAKLFGEKSRCMYLSMCTSLQAKFYISYCFCLAGVAIDKDGVVDLVEHVAIQP